MWESGSGGGGAHDGCSGLRDRGIVVQVIDKHRGLLVGGAPRLAMHQVVSCLQQNDTIGGAFGAMPLTPTYGKLTAEQSVVRNRYIPCLDGSYHHCTGTFSMRGGSLAISTGRLVSSDQPGCDRARRNTAGGA